MVDGDVESIQALANATSVAAHAQGHLDLYEVTAAMAQATEMDEEWRATRSQELWECPAAADIEECATDIRRERERSWAAWAREAVQGGARRAHRRTKVP